MGALGFMIFNGVFKLNFLGLWIWIFRVYEFGCWVYEFDLLEVSMLIMLEFVEIDHEWVGPVGYAFDLGINWVHVLCKLEEEVKNMFFDRKKILFLIKLN